MRLIYKETEAPVKVGDKVTTSSGEKVEVLFYRRPHKPESEGKVTVKHGGKNGLGTSEFYVGVIDAEWVEREDRFLQVDVEHTDTFGGEANYSWVARKRLELPLDATDRQIIMAAKKALGLSGVRYRRTNVGGNDTIQLDLVGLCQVVFIYFPE